MSLTENKLFQWDKDNRFIKMNLCQVIIYLTQKLI